MTQAINKILITDSYAGNIGDIGILISTIDQLKQNFPQSEITVESSHPNLLRNIINIENITLVPRIFDIEEIDSTTAPLYLKFILTFLGVYDLVSFFLSVVAKKIGMDISIIVRKSKRNYLFILLNTDLIISGGGGYLNSKFIYFFRLYIYTLGLLLNKQIILLAQSIGPFASLASKIAIPLFLNKAKYITLREPHSSIYLKNFNLMKKPKITADLAFLLKTNSIDSGSKKNKFNKIVIAISLKEDRCNIQQENFTKQIGIISNYLIKKNYFVLLMCHTYKDSKIADLIYRNILNKAEIDIVPFGIEPKAIKSLYGTCSLVIASRMHSIVFCSDLYVPFISISSDGKFIGLHKQLKYDQKLLLKYEDLTSDNLKNSVDYAIANDIKLKLQLRTVIPQIRKLSYLNMSIIKNCLL